MKKILFLLSLMLMVNVIPSSADCIDLSLSYVDPHSTDPGPNRGPVLVPEVSIDGHTLLFGTNCDGCTLRIVNENGELVYSAFVSSTTTSIILPAWLEGDYELQLYPTGLNYYFYGWIEL